MAIDILALSQHPFEDLQQALHSVVGSLIVASDPQHVAVPIALQPFVARLSRHHAIGHPAAFDVEPYHVGAQHVLGTLLMARALLVAGAPLTIGKYALAALIRRHSPSHSAPEADPATLQLPSQ